MEALYPVVLEDFDQLTGEDVETARKKLSMTSGEFAESLGWSKRKYQRLLEAAVDDGVPRDTALAIYGLSRFREANPSTLPASNIGALLPPDLFVEIAGTAEAWRVRVAANLMVNLVQRAREGATTTYGAEAEHLEDAGITDRVWPRTVYAHPLGLICEALIQLGEIGGKPIPLLTAIVVAQSGEPGAGFDGMVQRYMRQHYPGDYRERYREFRMDRPGKIAEIQREVFDFPLWNKVLKKLGLPAT